MNAKKLQTISGYESQYKGTKKTVLHLSSLEIALAPHRGTHQKIASNVIFDFQ